jgi:predicted transcriptional regulator
MSTDKEEKLEVQRGKAYKELKKLLGTSWDLTADGFISKVETLAKEYDLTQEDLLQAVTLVVYYL